MDSKVVNRAITAHIRPLLRRAGFSDSTTRTFWRREDQKIDVVNFQSFNSHLADGVGCTTYSFALRLGCYFSYLPPVAKPPKTRNGLPRPEEYECQFRSMLLNPLDQPEMAKRAAKIRDIWYIDSKGKYLEPIMERIGADIEKMALPWFERLASPNEVLRTLREDAELEGDTHGFGRNPSPIRSLFIGYAACHLGLSEVAAKELRAAIDSGAFTYREKEIQTKLANL
jgi:hypothetical protein